MDTIRQYIANRLVEEELMDSQMQPLFESKASEGDVMTILRLFKKIEYTELEPERYCPENPDILIGKYRKRIRELVTYILEP